MVLAGPVAIYRAVNVRKVMEAIVFVMIATS